MKKLLSLLCVLLLIPTARSATNSPAASVTLEDFKLVADLNGERAAFTLTATARVENSKGGSLDLLSGPVALTDVGAHKQWRVRAESNRYVLVFEHGGKFPLRLKFNAAVRRNDTWRTVDFRIAPSALRPIILQGLGTD